MNITIHDQHAGENYLELGEYLTKISNKKRKKHMFIHFIIGIALITFDYFNFENATIEGVFLGEQKSYSLHLSLGIGIVYIISGFSVFSSSMKEKTNNFNDLKKNAWAKFHHQNNSSLIISDDSVKYESYYMQQEIKWPNISSYMIFENYLALIYCSSISMNLIIHKKMISENDYQILLSFLKQHKLESKSIYELI
jgi:hypothetical protein